MQEFEKFVKINLLKVTYFRQVLIIHIKVRLK